MTLIGQRNRKIVKLKMLRQIFAIVLSNILNAVIWCTILYGKIFVYKILFDWNNLGRKKLNVYEFKVVLSGPMNAITHRRKTITS